MQRLLGAEENSSAVISYFKGLDRRNKGSNGGFLDMVNMTSSGYPCLMPRGKREYLADDGIKNKRLVIPPVNKRLSDEVPGFTGVAGMSFYYEGNPCWIDYNSFGSMHIYEDAAGKHYIDVSEIFPENEDVQLNYCYFNNRLFITVASFSDCGFEEPYLVTADNISGNIITLTGIEAAESEKFIKLKGRNIKFENTARGGSDYYGEYYAENVEYNSEEKTVKITINKDFCTTPWGQVQSPVTEWGMKPIKDKRICCFDAGKDGAGLYNAEKGIRCRCVGLKDGHYNDTVLGITYTDLAVFDFNMQDEDGVISDYFSEGDRVAISGCYYKCNNTNIIDSDFVKPLKGQASICTVVGIDDDSSKLYVEMFDECGNKILFDGEIEGSTTHVNYYRAVYKPIPKITAIVAHNQRLWGVNPNGEYAYASAVSDPFTWYDYGTSSEAISIQADTKDEFTGITAYNQYVLLMKPTSIQQVYALASSSSVQIAKALHNAGCIDINSVVVIANTVYYLGYNGFYRYSGTEPELISTYLNTKYISANAYTDGLKYYASAKKADGETELIVFDTQRGYWHKEDDTDILGAYKWYDKTIVTSLPDSNGISKTFIVNSGDTEDLYWSAETVKMYEGTMDNKILNELWIRAYIPFGGEITVYTRTDDNTEWIKHQTLPGKGRTKIYRVPIRAVSCEEYQYRLEGKGSAIVYDIERRLAIDGRNYNHKR